MVKEIAKNLYCIEVPLPNNPLRVLNSYFIRGEKSDLLIDTGFRCDECYKALDEGLRELNSDPARLDVLLTHLHSDHSGMADLFVGKGHHIYMGAQEYRYEKLVLQMVVRTEQNERMISEGFPPELIEINTRSNPARTMALPEMTDDFVPLGENDVLDVGGYRLQPIVVPGHTPGHCMFWCEKQGILFTGDHVLFDITPNITMWPQVEDSLGSYLESLRKVRDLPVRQALPAHRLSGNFTERVDELLTHHEKRLQGALNIVTENPGLNAYQIAGLMRWKIRASTWEDFPPIQKFFAVGEALSHLDYLRVRGQIRCTLQDGIYVYERI